MSANEVWHYRMKSAQRDLIRLCGGIERAAEIASISSAHMGRMNNPKDPEIMPIPVVLALEAECQQAPVTEVIANVNGRRLSDPEEERTAAACFLSTYSEKRRQGAIVDSEVAIAMSDGKLSPSELQRLRREAGKERDAISEFCAVLDGAIASGGAKAALKLVSSGG